MAIVAAVVKSRMLRIRQWSRMWKWQVLEREEISLEKDKLELKMNPRFLDEEVRRICCVEGRRSDGLMI